MKSTGIVRRVDELGRIVIPKEIRNNLKIKYGDCLEVFLDDNKVSMKKKDLIENCPDSLNNLLRVVSKLLDLTILITDTDKFLYKEGNEFNDIVNKEISNEIYNLIMKRTRVINDNYKFYEKNNMKLLLEPIIANGDILGGVIFLKNTTSISKNDEFAITIITNLLINHLEV